MISDISIQKYLKKKYNLAIGERSAEAIYNDLKNLLNMKVKIQGRSLETGRKKTISIKVKDLL